MSAGRGLRPAHNRNCRGIGADGLSLRQSLGRPHVATRRWYKQPRELAPGVASPKVSGGGWIS